MKKKSLIVLFVSISAVLAFFASNRMSVNEAISDNIEALTAGDFDIHNRKGIHEFHISPTPYGNHWFGYVMVTYDHMRDGLPECLGTQQPCQRPTGFYCWSWRVY